MPTRWNENWRAGWTPTITNDGGLILTPGSSASDHARYVIMGRTCFVSYSQLFTLSGTTCTLATFTLPVAARLPRATFSADMFNQIARATTLDGLLGVALQRYDGSNFPTSSSYHISFHGFYEVAE